MVGCTASESIDLGPPEGWEAQGDVWWLSGADTSNAFRSLDRLADMGVAVGNGTLAATTAIAQQSGIANERMQLAIKQSVIKLYRTQPEVVDSLFDRFVVPKLAGVSPSENTVEQIEDLKKVAYNSIRSHYQEPRTMLTLGKEVPVPYPDSLRLKQIGGAVRMQVRLDAEGNPVAVKLVESVHPVLDAIAMQATTAMRWRPAYLIRKGSWNAIPAWARFTVRFRTPPTS